MDASNKAIKLSAYTRSESLLDASDIVSRWVFRVVIALTAHTILAALIIGAYRQVVKHKNGLVLELGRQWEFPTEKLGKDRLVELADEEETPEPEEAVEPEPEVADDPLPETVEQREIVEMGTGGVSASNTPDPTPANDKLKSRVGEAKQAALSRYGGDEETEAAVQRALAWLARHQSLDGRWDLDGYDARCRDNGCRNEGKVLVGQPIYDNGLTSLALLAFMGAGHDDEHGPYRENIKKGINYLLSQQSEDGALVLYEYFGIRYPMYDHAISLYALSEAYNFNQEERLREPIQRALNFLLQTQQAGGGWDYEIGRTDRNDVSITGWVVMALESCRLGGFDIGDEVYDRTLRMLHKMTLSSGLVKYTDRNPGAGQKGVGVTAVSLYARMLMGDATDTRSFERGLGIVADEPPNWDRLISEGAQHHTMYYWYYGTLAMFHSGSKEWSTWNRYMKSALLGHQRTTGCAEGSWDPAGPWLGKFAGRVYATCMGALSLEVYYRYLPLYQKEVKDVAQERKTIKDLGDTVDWMVVLSDRDADGRDKKEILRLLEDDMRRQASGGKTALLTEDMTGAVITALEGSGDTMLRFTAIGLLLDYGQGRDRLVACYRGLLAGSRGDKAVSLINALVNLNGVEASPDIIAMLNHEENDVRSSAHSALIALTGETALPARADAWREWWSLNGADLRPR